MNRPIILPTWVVAMVSLASGIVIVAGSVIAIAFWQVSVVKQAPLTQEERDHLEANFRGGTFVNEGTYRTCINGQEWFFYSSGKQSSNGTGCWK